MIKRRTTFCAAAGMALTLLSVGCSAQVEAVRVTPVLEERFAGTVLDFALEGDFHNVTVTVAGPDRYSARAFSEKGVPPVELKRHGIVRDGFYRYQITAATGKTVSAEGKLDNGRGEKARRTVNEPWSYSGFFNVRQGTIEAKDMRPEPEKRSKEQ